MSRKLIAPIEVPEDYFDMDIETRKNVCNELIDNMILIVDRQLPQHINRIDWLKNILASSLAGAVDTENYEAATLIRDCQKLLDE